jgi:cysteinyl-tRNA synthetase
LKFYNTLHNKIEEFVHDKKKPVTLYTCGPTVYNHVHIGNLRAMLVYDILKKYLRYKGFEVRHVMNITDVDDKTIKGSKEAGKTLKDYTEFYTKSFLHDLKELNIEIPETMPKATQEIDSMVEMIQILLEKGFAYKNDKGDIYFKISKQKDYGKLANLQVENLIENAEGRLDDEYDKEDAKDFALWKSYDEDDGDVYWDTPIGKGRPGWHTECCAMSNKYLGLPIDIHMGGIDLIFPHHTNEIAQAEAAYGKKFVKFWLHNDHLIVDGEKMSKSMGNFFTLKDLLERGNDSMAIKYELLKTNYRQRLDFKVKDLRKNKDIIDKFYEFIDKLEHVIKEKDNLKVQELIEKAKQDFEKEMDMDLNVSGALNAIFIFINNINKIIDDISKKDAMDIIDTMKSFDSVLGILIKPKEDIPLEIKEIAQKRQQARENKDYEESDRLRDEIKKKGYIISDEKQGFRIRKA